MSEKVVIRSVSPGIIVSATNLELGIRKKNLDWIWYLGLEIGLDNNQKV